MSGRSCRITDYVAHRIVEREKALISDTVDLKPQIDMSAADAPKKKGSPFVLLLVAICVGLLTYWAAGALSR